MQVAFVNRAEIAHRSLGEDDRLRVASAIQRLHDLAPGGLARFPEIKAMASGAGDRLYAYDAGDILRIVFSLSKAGVTIEDIVPSSRIARVA